ncbi:MAG: serine/threonine protein kinase [Ktedonobacteraceae bacterium]
MLGNRQLGNYRLLRRIGSGGMGEVYVAEDTRIARQVAIKVIHAEIDPYSDQETIQASQKLFLREMRAITMLDHPCILQLFDFGEEQIEGSILTYMVMPLRLEGSLLEWLQKRGEPLNLSETAHFLMQAAEALQHAHDRALIHQDVKPANFLVRNRTGSVLPDILLSDFGIARMMSTTSTASQVVRGSPAYMAPEQWEGRPVPASDQYALGIMAYTLLTRQPPFSGRMEQLMRQHLMVQPPLPSTINPAIPPDLDKVTLTALAKQPEERFPSIMAFARAFQQAVQSVGEPECACAVPDVDVALMLASEAPSSDLAVSAVPTMLLATDTHPPMLSPAPNRVAKTYKPGRLVALLCVIVLLVISTIIGWGTYQGHVTSVNARLAVQTQDAGHAQAILTAQRIPATVQTQGTTPAVSDNSFPVYMGGSGTLALQDSLNAPNNWSASNGGSFGEGCVFQNNTFHVSENKSGHFFLCTNNTQFSDFALEVHLEIINGNCSGVTIRNNQGSSHFYFFSVCADGSYAVLKYIDSTPSDAVSLASGNSSAIHAGLSVDNILGIVAKGSSMIFYVNKQQIRTFTDGSYSGGYIGLCAKNMTSATEAAFSNMRIWK